MGKAQIQKRALPFVLIGFNIIDRTNYLVILSLGRGPNNRTNYTDLKGQ